MMGCLPMDDERAPSVLVGRFVSTVSVHENKAPRLVFCVSSIEPCRALPSASLFVACGSRVSLEVWSRPVCAGLG